LGKIRVRCTTKSGVSPDADNVNLRVRVRVRVRVDLVNCKVVIDYFFGVKLKILLRVSSYLAIFRQEY